MQYCYTKMSSPCLTRLRLAINGLLRDNSHKYNANKKRERQTAFGSLNYDTGQITVSFAQQGNSKTFKKHLKKVSSCYKAASKIIMVLDNVAYHHANRIKKWLQKNPKLELFFCHPIALTSMP
jgi:hypothetical protein